MRRSGRGMPAHTCFVALWWRAAAILPVRADRAEAMDAKPSTIFAWDLRVLRRAGVCSFDDRIMAINAAGTDLPGTDIPRSKTPWLAFWPRLPRPVPPSLAFDVTLHAETCTPRGLTVSRHRLRSFINAARDPSVVTDHLLSSTFGLRYRKSSFENENVQRMPVVATSPFRRAASTMMAGSSDGS